MGMGGYLLFLLIYCAYKISLTGICAGKAFKFAIIFNNV